MLFARSTLEYSVVTDTGAQVSGLTRDPSGAVLDSFQLPTAGCQPAAPDGGTTDGGADGGDPGTADAGGATQPGGHHSCQTAGATPLWALLAFAAFRKRVPRA